MHNLVYLAQRRSQEFSCEPNFGVGGVPPVVYWGYTRVYAVYQPPGYFDSVYSPQ